MSINEPILGIALLSIIATAVWAGVFLHLRLFCSIIISST
jgi:hypothetical protein